MRICVTGGFGFAGARVVAHLLSSGHEVSVVSVSPPASDLPLLVRNLPIHLADITDRGRLAGAFDGCEGIVHAAALPAEVASADPALALRVNGYGTRVVLDEAMRAGVRRAVYMSSYHVYGRQSGRFDEATPTRPVTDYAISKTSGEGMCFRAAKLGGLETFIARFSNGFGAPLSLSADCWMLAFPSFCRSAVETGRVILQSPGMQQRDFLPLSDMCRAIELLLETPALVPGDTDIVFNVGGGRSMSMREAAQIVAAEYGGLTGCVAPVELPLGGDSASAEAPIDYRYDRIASLGYRPIGDLGVEVRDTLRLLAVGSSA